MNPLARNDICSTVRSASSTSPPIGNTILLVDDDRKTLRPLRILLEEEGYRVLTALSGEAAISITEVERPDLIVTDWMMPGMDGVALCRWLKDAAIPVVMVSAAQPPHSGERLWDVQLMKPTPIGHLIEVVNNLVEMHP
jgi:DNA-binding response OmpR family regulator